MYNDTRTHTLYEHVSFDHATSDVQRGKRGAHPLRAHLCGAQNANRRALTMIIIQTCTVIVIGIVTVIVR